MNTRNRFLHLAILIVLVIVLLQSHWLPLTSQAFDSPLPTPHPEPAPTAVPRCHALAIAYVARERSIAEDALIAGSYISNENGKWITDSKEEWFEFPLIGRRACFVKVNVKDSDMVYSVALDEQGQIVDLEELRTLEREAEHSECGKFAPALCARIPMLAGNEQVEVAIWLENIDVKAIYDAVAADYPASLQLEKGLLFDVNHPDYEKAFREVEDRMSRVYQESEAPVVAFLEAKGFKASYASTTAPIVFAELHGDIISALANRDDVVGIYLLEGQLEDRMDSIAPTIRMPRVWSEGYTGNGVKVAVIEDDPVDFGNQYLDHVSGVTGPPELAWYNDDMLHPTQTAGVIAMKDYPLYQGIAPDVTLYSADAGSYDPQSNIADASDWATGGPNYVDVLNLSFGNSDPPLDFWSRYFDHMVWHHRRMVVAAGNEGEPPPSMGNPDSAYNVLTVGGFDDHDNSNWSDDTMSDFSSYTGPGSRDKPEVVAVGERVCTADLSGDDVGCGVAGTSFAAPQVSGLAALLTEKLGSHKPELIKAIVMASAVHNIEGDSRLSDYDGTGAIDAALAYEIADHGHYGTVDDGWYVYEPVFYNDFDAQGYLHHYVPVSRGEKVRVVLTYSSHPDSADPYNNDLLASDLDLRVMDPYNSLVAASSSAVNNFEIVEFIAGQTGNYDIRVKRTSWNTVYEFIGLAWVKDATYLPDLRNKDGWVSELYVRNDGAEWRDVKVQYYNTNGNPGVMDTCGLAPNQWCPIVVNQLNRIPYGTTGSAIVSGGEDVSVVMKQVHVSGGFASGAYVGVSWPGTEVHIPVLHKNNNGWQSQLYVQNAGTTSTNVTVEYKARTGSNCTQTYYNVPASATRVIDLIGIGCIGTTFVGSARVVGGQPLVATATQYYGNTSYMETSYTEGRADIVYTPLVQNNNSRWLSGLALQNVSGGSNNVSARFYNNNGDWCNTHSASVAPYFSLIVYPAPPTGNTCSRVTSGRHSVTNGLAQVTLNQQLSGMPHVASYAGIANPGASVIVPWLYRWNGWNSGLVVQNVDAIQPAVVTITYYNGDGTRFGNPTNGVLQPGGIGIFNPAPPGVANFDGSAVVTADRPIAVIANIFKDDANGDHLMSYAGVSR